jgi:hypothetical protein
MTKTKQDKKKNYIVVYNGNIGKKAETIKTAIVFAKEYIGQGKCKKAEIYEIVREVQ